MAARPKTICPSLTVNFGSPWLTSGRQHLDAELAGVGDVIDHDVALVAVVDLAGQQRGHELGGVVALQVRGLIADLGVGGRMRLVETVTPELHDQLEDFLRRVSAQAALLRALARSRPCAASMMSCFFLLIALMQA